MKKLAAGVIVVLALSLFIFWYATRAHSVREDFRGRGTVSVVLTDGGFQPRDFVISAGTTVVFTTTRQNRFWPASNPHPEHTIHPAFDPGYPIEPDGSWSFTFNAPGVWGYHDHMRSFFSGRIYVE